MPTFLLSPADCRGRRAEQLLRPGAAFPLAVALRAGEATLGWQPIDATTHQIDRARFLNEVTQWRLGSLDVGEYGELVTVSNIDGLPAKIHDVLTDDIGIIGTFVTGDVPAGSLLEGQVTVLDDSDVLQEIDIVIILASASGADTMVNLYGRLTTGIDIAITRP